MPEDPFNPITPEGITARLDELRRKLKARDGKPAFKVNVEEIRKEIDRLEGLLPPGDPDE